MIERGRATHAVVITDDNVQKPHAMSVAESLANEDIESM